MAEKPHLCFISTTVYSYLADDDIELAGGAERQQFLLGSELSEKGYQVSYITGVFESVGRTNMKGFEVHQSIPLESGITGAPLKIWRIFNAIRECDADIYYVRGNPFHCIIVSNICKMLNKEFVYSIANDAQVDPKRLKESANIGYRKLYMNAVGNASEVATLTNHQKELLREEHGIDATFIPVGYDVPSEEEILPVEDREFVFWAGRIVEYNKPNAFIDLAKEFPELKFVMAGPSEVESDLDAKIMDESSFEVETLRNAREVSNLEYIGFVPPDEIHEYFRKAIAYIQTTDAIADIGNTTLEAWRYATPIITLYTTYDGKIETNELGLYSDSSFEKLVDNMEALVNSPELQEKLGKNGREHLKDNFSLEEITSRYEKLFERAHKTS